MASNEFDAWYFKRVGNTLGWLHRPTRLWLISTRKEAILVRFERTFSTSLEIHFQATADKQGIE